MRYAVLEERAWACIRGYDVGDDFQAALLATWRRFHELRLDPDAVAVLLVNMDECVVLRRIPLSFRIERAPGSRPE